MAKKLTKITQKKHNAVMTSLNIIDARARESLDGYVKLEHTVQFDCFPGSLVVTCYFSTQEHIIQAQTHEQPFQKLLHQLLFKQGILLKQPKRNLCFRLIPE